MNQTKRMNEEFYDIIADFFFATISVGSMLIGLDSIPDNQTIIQIVTSPTTESGVDVTQKIMTIVSLIVSTTAGLIPIIKTIRRNKK